MSAIPPISATAVQPIAQFATALTGSAQPVSGVSFSEIIAQGLHSMETKVARADELVKQFALNDSIPVHQVTYALEEAKLAVELAMQVRTRLLEGYRELMNMQL